VLSPLTGAMADRTFTEMSLFLRMMSLAMTRRPSWVEQIAGQMEGVADVRRQQLRQVTTQVHNAERKRQGLAPVVGKVIGPAPPAALPADVANAATPVNESESGPKPTSASVDAKPVSIKINALQKSMPPAPLPAETKTAEAIEKKVEEPSSKPKPEPGFEFIPKKQGSS
jgi:hypothetical protein